jgi:hypothetical protein
MTSLIGILVFVGLILVIAWIGKWILGPIDRAAKHRQAPARVSIGDLLCLFVVVQLPLTAVSQLRGSQDTETHFWMFTILAWVVAPIIWIACALALSRAGITSGKHRFAFMALVLPVVYYGLIPFMVLSLAGVMAFLFDGQVNLARNWPWILGWACLGLALAASGRYTNWLVREYDQPLEIDPDTVEPLARLDDSAVR